MIRLQPNIRMALHNLPADLISDSRNPLLKVDDVVRVSLEGNRNGSNDHIQENASMKRKQEQPTKEEEDAANLFFTTAEEAADAEESCYEEG
jgi:hypothetical protein